MRPHLDALRGFKLALGNLVVLCALLSVVWAAGEIYYRFVFDSTDSFGLTKVSVRWFERHYQKNQLGVRDNVEYTMQKVDSRRRITFLGDSFTAGHGIADVDDRFANRIRRAHPTQWDVHVLAENALDTGKELKQLLRVADKGYEFDVLVLVYVLNDISDIVPEWSQIMARVYRNVDREGFVFEHSFFANELYYRWRAARDPDVANYYGFIRSAYEGDLWNTQKQRLASLRDFCAERDAQLLVVTFPLLHALGPEYPYRAVHAEIDAFWAQLDVPHLDLYGLFGDYPPEQVVIGKYDAHPNEFAHQLAAEAIGSFLEHGVEPRARARVRAVETPLVGEREPAMLSLP